MIEKRFTVHIVFSNLEKTEGEIELKDNGQPLLISESIDDVRYLKDLLNCLNDENEEFKKALIELKEIGDYQDGRIKELSDENEQLKLQMQRLYNYFADWFDDRVPPSDFSEMWDFVKEDEKWD